MSEPGHEEALSLIQYATMKTAELVEVLVRDFGVPNSQELRDNMFSVIGSVVADLMDRKLHGQGS